MIYLMCAFFINTRFFLILSFFLATSAFSVDKEDLKTPEENFDFNTGYEFFKSRSQLSESDRIAVLVWRSGVSLINRVSVLCHFLLNDTSPIVRGQVITQLEDILKTNPDSYGLIYPTLVAFINKTQNLNKLDQIEIREIKRVVNLVQTSFNTAPGKTYTEFDPEMPDLIAMLYHQTKEIRFWALKEVINKYGDNESLIPVLKNFIEYEKSDEIKKYFFSKFTEKIDLKVFSDKNNKPDLLLSRFIESVSERALEEILSDKISDPEFWLDNVSGYLSEETKNKGN